MTKETLNNKITPKGMSNFGNSQLGSLRVKYVKEKIQNAQRRLKEWLDLMKEEGKVRFIEEIKEEINKIFKEEFGGELI